MDIELNTDTNAAEVGKINRYILSGDLLAGRVTKEFTRDATTKVIATPVIKKYWYHLDHLNSTKAMTNEAGTLEILYEYRAFGEQLKKLDGNGNETDEDRAKYSFEGMVIYELDKDTFENNKEFYDIDSMREATYDFVKTYSSDRAKDLMLVKIVELFTSSFMPDIFSDNLKGSVLGQFTNDSLSESKGDRALYERLRNVTEEGKNLK